MLYIPALQEDEQHLTRIQWLREHLRYELREADERFADEYQRHQRFRADLCEDVDDRIEALTLKRAKVMANAKQG